MFHIISKNNTNLFVYAKLAMIKNNLFIRDFYSTHIQKLIYVINFVLSLSLF